MRGTLGIIFLIAFFASPLTAQELTGTLKQIKKKGKIRNFIVGVRQVIFSF